MVLIVNHAMKTVKLAMGQIIMNVTLVQLEKRRMPRAVKRVLNIVLMTALSDLIMTL